MLTFKLTISQAPVPWSREELQLRLEEIQEVQDRARQMMERTELLMEDAERRRDGVETATEARQVHESF